LISRLKKTIPLAIAAILHRHADEAANAIPIPMDQKIIMVG